MPTPKPTDDILWAESASPGDVVNPSAKRSGGWLFKDPLPAAALNYLLRAAGRFASFAADKFNAAGWLTLGSQFARLEVVTDTSTTTRWDFLGGSSVNEVRMTHLVADSIKLSTAGPQITSGTLAEIDIVPDTPILGDVRYVFDSTAVGGEAYVDANVLTAVREVTAPNTARMAGLIGLVGDSTNTAQIDTPPGAFGFNIGSGVIVTPTARRRLRITLASGNLTQSVAVVSVRTHNETRDITATVVAINNAVTPAQIDVVLRDNAGLDVLATNSLALGESIQVHIIAY